MTSEPIRGFWGARGELPPLTYTLPAWEAPAPPKRRSGAGVLAGLAMYGTAVWMVVSNDSLRRVEARLLAPIAGFVTGRHGAVTTDERVYFGGSSFRHLVPPNGAIVDGPTDALHRK